jgi:alpha-beta hydrolase superfamily lysophospholipase
LVRRTLAWLACGSLAACVVAPRLQTATNEPQHARLEQDFAVMLDGAKLPLRAWLPDAAPAAVILAVHGLGDHAGSFETTGSFLAASGFAVYAFDQRGFGRTAQRGIWAGGDRMADDVHEVARLLRLRHPDARLYGLGESMGGAVLLHALHRHPPGWIDGAALLAPAVWSRAEMSWYARMPMRVFAHSWRGMKLSGRITGRVPTDDAQALRQRHEDPLVIQRVRVDMLWGLADLMDAATSEPAPPAPPAVPVLVLYGAHDEIVPREAVCAWIQTSGPNGDRQLAFYPDGWHLLTRDRNARTVHGDLAAWFTRPGMGLPSGADGAMPVERLCAP